jgi:hypothetical protein
MKAAILKRDPKKLEKVFKKYKVGEHLDDGKFVKFFHDFCSAKGMAGALAQEHNEETKRQSDYIQKTERYGAVRKIRENRQMREFDLHIQQEAWVFISKCPAAPEVLFSLMDTAVSGSIDFEAFQKSMSTDWPGNELLIHKTDFFRHALAERLFDWQYVRERPEMIHKGLIDEIVVLPSDKSVAIQYRNGEYIVVEVEETDTTEDFRRKAIAVPGCFQTMMAHRFDVTLHGKQLDFLFHLKPPLVVDTGVVPGQSILFDYGRTC